jgi:hypothetical protein
VTNQPDDKENVAVNRIPKGGEFFDKISSSCKLDDDALKNNRRSGYYETRF